MESDAISPISYQRILREGLWQSNPGLVQLLGLCPLLAVTNTLVNGLALGLATMAVLMGTNTLISATRRWMRPQVRLPAFVLVIAASVTAVELIFEAYFYQLYRSLGIFIPLIVTNCIILGRAEAFASRRPLLPALLDGFAQGAGFALLLLVLGTLRELLGYGTLFRGADMLLGPAGSGLTLAVFPRDAGLLLAVLPPGAFFALALLVAGHKALGSRRGARRQAMEGAARITANP